MDFATDFATDMRIEMNLKSTELSVLFCGFIRFAIELFVPLFFDVELGLGGD